MTNEKHNTRAVEILNNNRYFTLATCTNGQPWTAPLAFAECSEPAGLMFTSSNKSRHIRELSENSKVAGAIFNSTLPTSEVDGIQFEGVLSEIKPLAAPGELLKFTKQYLKKQGKVFGGIPQKMPDLSYRLYKIEIARAWVCDLDAYDIRGTDERIKVDVEKVFSEVLKS